MALEFGQVALLGLVRFGQYGNDRYGKAAQVGCQFKVQFLRGNAGVEQNDHGFEVMGGGHVPLDELGPLGPFGLGALGVTVAGQVDEEVPVGIDFVVVEAARLARLGTDFGQLLATGQPVDEGGLAHIGAPGQGDLGFLEIFKLLDFVYCFD